MQHSVLLGGADMKACGQKMGKRQGQGCLGLQTPGNIEGEG